MDSVCAFLFSLIDSNDTCNLQNMIHCIFRVDTSFVICMKQTRMAVKLIQHCFDKLDIDKDAYRACNYEHFKYATSPDYHAHRIITRQAATTVI